VAELYSFRLTKQLLISRRFAVGKLESFNAMAEKFFRKDVFGFDLVACRPDFGTLMVQATTGENLGRAKAKLAASREARICLQSGNKAQIWSWRPAGLKGQPKVLAPRIEQVILVGDQIQFVRVRLDDFDRTQPNPGLWPDLDYHI
jgi:hypothetical protein